MWVDGMLAEASDVSCDVERVPPETAEDTTLPMMHPKETALLQFDRYMEAYCPKQLSGFLFVAGQSNSTRQRARGGARARKRIFPKLKKMWALFMQ